MAKYYKKVFVDRPWNRPNLTSNGVLGGDSFACISLTPIDSSTYDAWRLFNGLEGEDTWFSTSSQGAFVFYNPYPLKVESFEVVNWYGPYNYSSCWGKGSVYGSNDNVNWIKLADFINENHYNSGDHWTIPVNSTGYYKYHKVQILENVPSSGGTLAREMYITAIQQVSSWAKCTKEEYDQLPNDQRKIVTDVYSIFNRNKYCKKTSTILPWEQPILKSNGTFGGDSFAVDSPSYVSGYYPFYAFDGSTTSTAVAINSKNPYKMYFPVAVNISNIKSVGYHDSSWLLNSYRIAYSDDDVTYTNATEILTATDYTINANIDKAVGCHKYWEIVPITCSSAGWSVRELYVQAHELSYTWTECTKEEYNQSPDDDRKIVTNTYALYSSTTANLYKTLNSSEYTSETQAQEGVNGIKFSPSNLYGMTSLSSYIRISQNQKVVFELPDNLVRVNYVHHKGYVIGNAMPPSNINQVDISNDGTNWTTVATYSMPTYGIGGDVENQLDLPKIKYIRFNFWFHGSGYPAYYGSGGVGSVYINCLIREGGKEKSVNLYYLGGDNNVLTETTVVRDIDLDFTKCACSTNSTYGLSTTSHELRVLFLQPFNPNYFLVDNINAQLVQLHLRITASHIGGGDSICNHSLRLFYVDGTTKDFTSTNNGACMNSGSTEFIIPEQSKPFNKFQYFANEYYRTGQNVGCNAYLTFISAKEKKVVYVQS